MTLRLDGKEASQKIREWVTGATAKLKREHGIVPQMVTVQVGAHPASERYIHNQLRACKDVGLRAGLEQFDADTPKEQFLKYLTSLGRNQDVDGIILQTPFPTGWRSDEILSALPSSKDIEGVHPENLGRLYLGESGIPLPCTAWSALSLLEWYGRSNFEQTRCTVVGRSPNVGRAVAMLLMHKQGTVTICHTRTSEGQLQEILTGSDVVVVAAGVPGIIKQQELPAHAWVVDVGTNVTPAGKLVGDVDVTADGHVEALSPVPGGVGPLTVSLLLANLVLCASRRRLGQSWTLPDFGKLRGACCANLDTT